MRILVVNAGSSSLKLRLLEGDTVLGSEDLPSPDMESGVKSLGDAIRSMRAVHAVGHRIVHGGTEFVEPILVDEHVVQRLRALTDLAPLHQPKSLAALEAVSQVLPDVPAVACFDTAFHAGMPPAATTYALPAEWRERWPLRRFGFHGLSHAYASHRSADMVGRRPEDLRIVTCHLGAGASLAAVHGGRSVDTTMGFTPLEGLVMATRAGNVDPGLLMWLEEHVGIEPHELAEALEKRSGLVGLAGTPDMREVIKRSKAGDPNAALAFGLYTHRLRAGIASMAAAMDGMDILVFTGGVGENSPEVREQAAAGLSFLGVAVDPAANRAGGDRDISESIASVRTLVIAAREDIEIAGQVKQVLL
ncbi:MAG TPA: acetate/propionate family kinase [Chloroflexota bacterium]|nr:acetate/propionate family kinase [Chloroflexota bacterium]